MASIMKPRSTRGRNGERVKEKFLYILEYFKDTLWELRQFFSLNQFMNISIDKIEMHK